jgi:hypothetical protein
MTAPVPQPLLPYADLRRGFAHPAVRDAEVPTGHSVSLPVPTLRQGVAGYAGFAGPALRRPGVPLRLGTPDRWWVVDAGRGALLSYGRTAAIPFADDLPAGPVTVDLGRTVAEAREDLAVLTELIDTVAPRFFAGDDADPAARRATADQLTAVVGAGTVAWYRALAPDFFAWLER